MAVSTNFLQRISPSQELVWPTAPALLKVSAAAFPMLEPSWSTKPALHATFVRSFFLLPNLVIIVFSRFFFVFHYFFLLLPLVVGVSTAYILTGRASRMLYLPAHRQDLFDLEALGVGYLLLTQT